MSKKAKQAIIFSVFMLLGIPYFVVVISFSMKYPTGTWPDWTKTAMLPWFAAMILIPGFLGRILFRKEEPVDSEKSRATLKMIATVFTRLVIFWILLFLYGLVETIRGKFAIKTAIVPGIFLLFFIAVFGESVYQAKRTLRKFTATDRR